jgi:hypothetical protein
MTFTNPLFISHLGKKTLYTTDAGINITLIGIFIR